MYKDRIEGAYSDDEQSAAWPFRRGHPHARRGLHPGGRTHLSRGRHGHASVRGVCKLEALRRMALSGMPPRTYYVLRPEAQKGSSTVYMPVARGNAILRPLLSESDIRALIRRSSEYAGLWIPDSKQRKEAFTHILSEGNYAKIIRMIAEIHEQNDQRTREGKKPCAADEAILAEAEQLLHQEFSYVLHMSQEETVAFVCRELGMETDSLI